MRTRTRQFSFFLNAEEKANLQSKATAAGMSCSEYIRKVIAEAEVKEAPQADVPLLIRDVRRVGYKVEVLLKSANTTHVLDAPELRRTLVEAYLVFERIHKIYTNDSVEEEKTNEI